MKNGEFRKYSDLEDYALDQAIKTLARLAKDKKSERLAKDKKLKHLRIVRGDK